MTIYAILLTAVLAGTPTSSGPALLLPPHLTIKAGVNPYHVATTPIRVQGASGRPAQTGYVLFETWPVDRPTHVYRSVVPVTGGVATFGGAEPAWTVGDYRLSAQYPVNVWGDGDPSAYAETGITVHP